ncbi:ABC transporter [Thermincola ferriacetica]|uniref:ABC transporter n=1 Tax=Thermincola ferriacetica TaxID=281456 RepID=A0A0L6W050_9FIRM|nr:urea ABC transporter ATP-binding protein UrtD [Thermincola ferriacetica]KNZ68937.1 ABC transporter [Thermincola ferriacetica]
MAGTILYLENVTVDFDGFKAIQNLNSYIEYGELRFLIGPNGAGKTTLLDVICGKTKLTEGRVIFDNTEITRKSEHEIVKMGICRKFQTPSVFNNLTVFENLELAVQKHRGILASLFRNLTAEQAEKINATLENIGLADQAGVKAGSLSHGQKQWLEIGMQLVQDPELLLLDEPVAGMTKKETEKTGQLLREIAKNRSVLVVEHDMEFVRNFAQKVTVMHEGKILCEGTVDKVQSDPKVIEVYLGRGRENVKH